VREGLSGILERKETAVANLKGRRTFMNIKEKLGRKVHRDDVLKKGKYTRRITYSNLSRTLVRVNSSKKKASFKVWLGSAEQNRRAASLAGEIQNEIAQGESLVRWVKKRVRGVDRGGRFWGNMRA